jgi:hypothetical protein
LEIVSLKAEIVKTLEQLKEEGNQFVKSANEFAVEPLILERRATMISASRLLVRQVTKLLILGKFHRVLVFKKEKSSKRPIARSCTF